MVNPGLHAGRLIQSLALDLEVAEQRDFTTVKFDPVDKVGAHQFDMLLGFVKHIGIIDQDLTDVATQVVTDRPHNDITLLMNKERGMAMFCGVFDGFPMFEQYVESLQLFFWTYLHQQYGR